MIPKLNNSAYIDGANLHKGGLNLGTQKNIFELVVKEKAPNGDGIPQGSFS